MKLGIEDLAGDDFLEEQEKNSQTKDTDRDLSPNKEEAKSEFEKSIEADMANYTPPKVNKKIKSIAILASIIAVILAIGYGIYMSFGDSENINTPSADILGGTK